MDFTKELQWGASFTALLTLLDYVKLLPASLTNAGIVLVFGVIYLLFCARRGGFSLLHLIPITCAIGIMVINKDPSMISLTVIWFLIDIFSNTELDITKICKSFFYTGLTGYILTLAAYFSIGFNKSSDIVMWRIDHLITRSALGFLQANTSMMYALVLVMTAVIAFPVSWKRTITIIAISSGLFYFNQSRTSFILILIVALGTQFNVRIPMIRLAYLCIAFLSYSLLVNPVQDNLDALLSGRLTLYLTYLRQFGVHLLGSPSARNAMIDNGYIQMIFSKGILFTLLFVLSLQFIFRKKSRLASVLAFAYLLSAFTETTFQHFDLLLPILLAYLTPNFNEQNYKEKEFTNETTHQHRSSSLQR